MNKEWFGKVENLKKEIERNLSENEQREFGSRLASLTAELNDKNKQIEQINREREELEKLQEVTLQMGMQISEQSKEIEQLNERYKSALRDKVDVYDELVECIKELVNRNARFMKNEIEICRLMNESAVMKRELE